jgi:hypothetical protein
MSAFSHILLQVGAGDTHAGEAALELELDEAVGRGWHVILRDLIVLRHVRVEITLAVKLRPGRQRAVEEQTGERSEAERLFVGHRQHAGQAEAHGADVGVRSRAEFVRASAPHL